MRAHTMGMRFGGTSGGTHTRSHAVRAQTRVVGQTGVGGRLYIRNRVVADTASDERVMEVVEIIFRVVCTVSHFYYDKSC